MLLFSFALRSLFVGFSLMTHFADDLKPACLAQQALRESRQIVKAAEASTAYDVIHLGLFLHEPEVASTALELPFLTDVRSAVWLPCCFPCGIDGRPACIGASQRGTDKGEESWGSPSASCVGLLGFRAFQDLGRGFLVFLGFLEKTVS